MSTINYLISIRALIIIKHFLSILKYFVFVSFNQNDMNIIILNLFFNCDVIMMFEDFFDNWKRQKFVVLLLALIVRWYCNSCVVVVIAFFVMLFFTWSKKACWDDFHTNWSFDFFTHCLFIVSRDVTTHNTEDCESRVLMIERSQR